MLPHLMSYVHLSSVDGYHVRDVYRLQLKKGEIAASQRIFMWSLPLPVVTKTHFFFPLIVNGYLSFMFHSQFMLPVHSLFMLSVHCARRPSLGVLCCRSTIGTFVLGFKNHFMSRSLQQVVQASGQSGMFIMVVERWGIAVLYV
jgi:hypothetical protein